MTKAKVRTFSAVDRDIEMLEAIAAYHGFSKSATIASLIRREFWRVFPAGTPEIQPDDGAVVAAAARRGAARGAKETKKR